MKAFVSWLLAEESKSRRIPDSAIKIDLPKVEQTKDYTCGAAALRAICLYYGVGPQEEDDYEELLNCTETDGTNPKSILATARTLGMHVLMKENMTLSELFQRLERKIPVICAVQAWGTPKHYAKNKSGHYVVAIGYDDTKVYFEDPSLHTSHRGFLLHQQFIDRWHDEDGPGWKHEQLGIAIWMPKLPDRSTVKDRAKVIEATDIK